MNLRQRLENHLKQIARERDPYLASGGHFLVREYICQQLAQWGEVETHEFEVKGNKYQNLILNLNSPQNQNLPPILIGAHYDAVPGTPGADDNATGVAVLLELASAFAAKPLAYPIQLVAFDLEECLRFEGENYCLSGSSAYAEYLHHQKQSLRLMLSLEMLGYCDRSKHSQKYPADFLKYFYPDRGDFIALVGNLKTFLDLIRLDRQIRKTGTPCRWLVAPNNGHSIQATRRSDHSPFWDRGYRAMMVTDTAFLRNPHYHKPSDTIDTLNLDFLTNVCKSLITSIPYL
ncbi:MAG: M28 family peptidase [Xenococcaceae cyanobacterium]